ncbi:hypothetical protein [Polynucleobacter sp. Nonnen-W13]|jgi:hypothetical protein|uniref:hypothetical protein n=1 Tax=Polynucleobacter sp. Nonnen-W13 TaxID=1855625 RepID=UPI001C0E2D47|nr:hypothetical protein [Polynucleobacter sp. Nonnen-W13]MBU3559379.1 hypothetical protein [Polynucleobacter sp. Nonnen-W13]
MTSSNHDYKSFLDLPDEQFMLAICVREENLKDPARWCAEMRALAKARKIGPKTSAEAEAMFEWAGRLAIEAHGERNDE